jgi:hypothetical protein
VGLDQEKAMTADLPKVPPYIAAIAASVDQIAYSHPSVSTPPPVDDGIAAYKAAHPGAYDTTTPPPAGAGPGGPVPGDTTAPWPPATGVTPWAYKTWENSLPKGTVIGEPPAARFVEEDLARRAAAAAAESAQAWWAQDPSVKPPEEFKPTKGKAKANGK